MHEKTIFSILRRKGLHHQKTSKKSQDAQKQHSGFYYRAFKAQTKIAILTDLSVANDTR